MDAVTSSVMGLGGERAERHPGFGKGEKRNWRTRTGSWLPLPNPDDFYLQNSVWTRHFSISATTSSSQTTWVRPGSFSQASISLTLGSPRDPKRPTGQCSELPLTARCPALSCSLASLSQNVPHLGLCWSGSFSVSPHTPRQTPAECPGFLPLNPSLFQPISPPHWGSQWSKGPAGHRFGPAAGLSSHARNGWAHLPGLLARGPLVAGFWEGLSTCRDPGI